MTIQWKNFLSQDFWFGLDLMKLHRIDWAIAYIGAGLFVLGVIFWLWAWRTRNGLIKGRLSQVGKIFTTIGIVEMAWFGIRYQQVAVLGTKFVAVLFGLVGLLWLIGPLKYFIKQYRHDVVAERKRLEKEKYLKM